MAVDPISFSKLLKKTDDIYEAVVVSSKRAKQILQDRIVKQMIDAIYFAVPSLFQKFDVLLKFFF